MSEDYTTSYKPGERLRIEGERLLADARQLLERFAGMCRQIDDMERRISQLARLTGAPPLGASEPPPGWRPLREAAEILGYTERDLLKHIKSWRDEGGVVWFGPVDGELFVDVAGAPLLRVVRKQ
jgi:hypothetical protein